jgi:HrpA-like RNA helicase
LLEPPNALFVKKSVEELVRLGAIDVEDKTGRESLTSLGKHLANLPLEARLGKLVLFGAAFGPAAADAALTIAAALTSRNPFLAPLEAREEAAVAKKSFADKMVGGPIGLSDHLAVLQAYQEWDELPQRGGERYEFCKSNFLSIKTLQGMSEMKRSLLETLSEAGFVKGRLRAKDVLWIGRQQGNDGVWHALLDRDAPEPEPCPPALVAGLLCAALFPQVATATLPKQDQPKGWKAKQNAAMNGGEGTLSRG